MQAQWKAQPHPSVHPWARLLMSQSVLGQVTVYLYQPHGIIIERSWKMIGMGGAKQFLEMLLAMFPSHRIGHVWTSSHSQQTSGEAIRMSDWLWMVSGRRPRH